MLRTSIGYHTFTIFKLLTAEDAYSLIKAFKKYRETTGNIVIYNPYKSSKFDNTDEPTDLAEINKLDETNKLFKTKKPDKCFRVEYLPEFKTRGINKWQIRIFNGYKNFKSYIVEATINPKVLAGIHDYITAANENHLESMVENFNIEANKISRILGQFSSFKPNRVDFCVNVDLKELGIYCTPEQMIQLIKRSNIPAYFTERKVYDAVAHRMKTDENSFYLVSKSVIINCYWKYAQLLKEYPDSPSLEESYNIIRFEVQCKYNKVYSMLRAIVENAPYSNKVLYELLSADFSKKVISNYFSRVILGGDYYTLQYAIQLIQSYCFKGQKEQRLINTLNLINQCRGISKALDTLTDEESRGFIYALNELEQIKINPVTMPKEFGIKRIPNILEAVNRLECGSK